MSNSIMRRRDGVTLVEVLIALVILLLVFVGLIQASLLVIDTNLRNEVRDEATRIGAEYMTRTRATNWAGLSATGGNDCSNLANFVNPVLLDLNYRNITRPQYFRVTGCVQDLDVENKQVGIQVAWKDLKTGDDRNHTIYANLRNK